MDTKAARVILLSSAWNRKTLTFGLIHATSSGGHSLYPADHGAALFWTGASLICARGKLIVLSDVASTWDDVIYDGLSTSDKFPTTALLSLILDGFYESARFLVLAGWDIKQEKWLKISQENWLDFWQNQWQDDWLSVRQELWLEGPSESPEHHDFMAWLRSQITEPKSLTWLCRDSIRRTLIQVSDGKEILSKVAQLPVPPRVISFLNLEDISGLRFCF